MVLNDLAEFGLCKDRSNDFAVVGIDCVVGGAQGGAAIIVIRHQHCCFDRPHINGPLGIYKRLSSKELSPEPEFVNTMTCQLTIYCCGCRELLGAPQLRRLVDVVLSVQEANVIPGCHV
eukprot:scaffold229047_cov23-Cyclotella_meneghiniana.AAC.1